MQREPTAISLVAMAMPSMPVRSQRPTSEKVLNSIPITPRSPEPPSQVVGDLQRGGHALRDGLGQRHERVDLPGVLAAYDVHARRPQPVAVRASLVPERVAPAGDDPRGGLGGQAQRAYRRG